ncbi:MAG TPA: hypothetical protein DEG96_02245 [Candidatus Atribacteria bacterium]|nr:hypothetical protein [Candidatus Atribacteria bacterium]
MVRINRKEIEYKNAFYHIIAKGVEGINIFIDDIDKNKFLQLLQKMVNSYHIHLFFYVLMDTHFHLLLKTEETNLSEAMQFLNSSYAHWFNLRHIRKGHLFQDRYKSYLILNPLYMYSVASYISLNPVEAGLVDSPENYPWCSFQYFISASGKTAPPWLKVKEFLKLCQTNADNFVNFVKDNNPKNHTEKVLQNFNKTTSNYRLNTNTQAYLPKNIENILVKVKERVGDIDTNKRLKHLLVYLLIKEGYRINDIATSLNLTRQSILGINRKIQKNLINDHFCQLLLNRIKMSLFT